MTHPEILDRRCEWIRAGDTPQEVGRRFSEARRETHDWTDLVILRRAWSDGLTICRQRRVFTARDLKVRKENA
jgi:hypothetical protein